MLCSIDDYFLADGTLAGGYALTGLRLKVQRIFDVVTPISAPLFGKNGDDSPQFLVVGMVYRIVLYQPGDDFTNVGGTNVSGNVFIATGTTPTSWTSQSELLSLSPALLDRNKRRAEISFTVQRIHDTIKDCENYINDHELTVPRTGDVKLLAMVSASLSAPVIALIVNGRLLSHELIKQVGKFTEHSYQIVGSLLFAPTPESVAITTEGGDHLTTEGGDTLVVE